MINKLQVTWISLVDGQYRQRYFSNSEECKEFIRLMEEGGTKCRVRRITR